ncbi:phosphatidate cytidylyltransferase [Virgibacillus soli]|uniref:phosphatidate cytidylyltransferase n=1 Tax=Paracerasibacillus soli TaxID=480284 RepID=UPI0035F0477A
MKQRIITATIALLVFLPFVIYGNWPFVSFIYILASIGLFELLRMKKITVISFPTIVAMIALWVLLLPKSIKLPIESTDIIVLFVILMLSYSVLKKNKFTFQDVGFVVLSTIYVTMGFFYFIETRLDGLSQIFYVLFVVWATDTGAYFVGRAFGKNKLWPEISPNKTIEGAFGGILIATVVGVIFHIVYPFPYSIIMVLCITVLISIFGQIGDLVESAYKRHFNVKDSGTLLPGHGGILDRFDSLLFVFPILHLFQSLFL